MIRASTVTPPNYLISASVLPLLVPLQQVPLIGPVLADVLDAPLRVLVEAGYDRTISPGEATGWDYGYFPDPAVLARNFLVAIPTGWDNGLQDLLGIRPFGTQRPGPYGVGGPDVSYLNSDATADATSPTSSAASELTTAPVTMGRSRRQASQVADAAAPASDSAITASASSPKKPSGARPAAPKAGQPTTVNRHGGTANSARVRAHA
ncbi:PE-PPE domain protein (fragment) [uncultured Mycobacterium sp.]|uniref:PE-PPE domain protein n=1 Tax=uncultured Mycobacterium sp. TaxID=171292 RepID=A0A1Y5PAA5_9MYCO